MALLPSGNAFANANKAMDHWFAHGPGAREAAPPRLHGGTWLPRDVLDQTRSLLECHGFMPSKGYLEPPPTVRAEAR